MKVDDNMVDRLAELAKLEFKGEEREAIKGDLNNMIAFIDQLGELDTENVEPLIFITDEVNHLREDEVKMTITQEEALKNAPAKDSDYFKVPKVIDKK